MAQAKYTLVVPQGGLATATHHYLVHGPMRIEGTYIDPGKRGQWGDDPGQQFDHVVVYAEDNPESDSHVKQTASYVGDIARQAITVAKDAKGGVNLWRI